MEPATNLPELKSLNISLKNGKPFAFRILLPPNISKTAPRDSIMVKIETMISGEIVIPEKINRGLAYSLEPPHIIIAMLIEHWCNGKLSGMLQLTRKQLHELLAPLQDVPAVYMLKDPSLALKWQNAVIPGIHNLLIETEEITPEEDSEPHFEKLPVKLEKFEATTIVAEDNLTKMTIDGSTNFLAITLPSRESIVYQDARELLVSHGFSLEPSNRKWWIRNRRKTLNFLAKHWNELKDYYRAEFSNNFQEKTSQISFAEISCSLEKSSGDHILNLSLHSSGFDERTLSGELSKGQLYMENGKRIVLVTSEILKKFTDTQRKLQNNPDAVFVPRVKRLVRHTEVESVYNAIEDFSENITLPDEWKSRINTFQDIQKLKPAPLKEEEQKLLRSYQQTGVAWLWKLYNHKLGGILADEMGLGKTLQALALIHCVKNTGENKPALIVCPASLVMNWERECKRFYPDLAPHMHYGPKRTKDIKDFQNSDIIITSYTTFSRDQNLLLPQAWSTIIADEAQHIKNPNSQNAASLRKVKSNSRFVLTGTPIENSINDLRSIFEFIMPGYLVKIPTAIKKDDKKWYHKRTQEQAIPYILRRTKKAVAPELPEKIEQLIFCEMTPEQTSIYSKTQEKTRQEIFEMEMSNVADAKVRMAAFKQLLRLRQICADPRLIDKTQTAENSAKLRVFLEILDEAIDGGHRMLVFSPFVSLLKLLQEELEKRDISYSYLDGQTKNRLDVCDNFNNDNKIPVFLISLKAGGVGLNLTGADTVLHFDPWWNPAVEDQATDRAHRIGQKRVVSSIKLIIANSIEEKVLDLQKQKSKLLDDLFEANAETNRTLGLEDIKSLLE